MKRLVVLFSVMLSVVARADDHPNFLFLLSDDQAWNETSVQMHPDYTRSKSAVIETPHLEKLASEGMRFSAAYSPASVCSPTRISLQTGKSPAQCGWTKAAPVVTAADGYKLIPPQSRKEIREDEVTIAEMLRTAGYATAHFGKWHLGRSAPENHGYDVSDGPTGNHDAAPHVEPNPVDIIGMGDRAMAFMEKNATEETPFFIQMSYHALHYPENARESLVEKYAKKMPRGNDKEIGRAALSEDLDRGVGLLLDKLDSLGIAGNTYVVYMSDNGSSTKGLLRGGKGGVWEGGIRVPFIVRGPGVGENLWCGETVVGYDLFPTFCELAGVTGELPDVIEGGSIVPLLRGESGVVQRPREALVFHFPHYQGDAPHTALMLGNYKLMRFYEDGDVQLYDLENDIGESRDLSDEQPDRVKEMVARMDEYLSAVGAELPVVNPGYDPSKELRFRKAKGDLKR